jgi:dihydroxyacetone kinase-like predicted kinase
MEEPRLRERVDDEAQNALIATVLEGALDAGQDSLKRGQDLLAVLREAGVVDAGGYGLTIIFAGVIAALRGAEPPPLEHHAPARVTHPQHASSTYRFCTNFAVEGEELEPSGWIGALEGLGDSVLVVGEGTTLKVHVHTDQPEAAIALFREGGAQVSHLDVADMHEQVKQRNERLARPVQRCIALAVVSSNGMRELFEGIGAVTLDGGPTLNPSTYELLAGIHEVPAEEVVVLPNSPNVEMAAERAAELSEKDVRVVRSRSMQAGLAAAVAMNPAKPCSANAAAMDEALARVRTGAVTGAARDDAVEATPRFRVGEAVGFVDEELIAWGDVAKTLVTVLAELSREAELVTLIEGAGAPLAGDQVAGLAPDGVELEYERGGQPAYWWLIAAE